MRRVRKGICCFAAAALLLSLCACGKNRGEETKMTGEDPAGSVTAETQPAETKPVQNMPAETTKEETLPPEEIKPETTEALQPPEETTADPEEEAKRAAEEAAKKAKELQSPPKLSIRCDGGSCQTGNIGYSWCWPRGDGVQGMTIACGPHPLQVNFEKKGERIIPVPEGALLQLDFAGENPPDEVRIVCWYSQYQSSGDVSEFITKGIAVELSSDGSFAAPTDASYVFSVKAEWKEKGEETANSVSGNAEYVFMTVPAKEPVDVFKELDLRGSLLQFGYFDGKEGERRFFNKERLDILEELSRVKAYPAEDFTADKMTYPVYSLAGGGGFGAGRYLWTNGYLVSWGGKAYYYHYDFSALMEREADVPGAKIGSPAELELGYLLVRNENGWIPERMQKAEKAERPENVSLSVKSWDADQPEVELTLKNKGAGSWGYGEDYWLEAYVRGSWYVVPVSQWTGLAFTAVGYPLDPYGEAAVSCSLTPFLPLPAGQYRIGKSIHSEIEPGETRRFCQIYAEITLDSAVERFYGEAPVDPDALRREYPQYFEWETGKGLEVYVWPGETSWSYRCVILPGTNREKTLSEVNSYPSLNLSQAKAVLSSYETPYVFVYFIGNYWADNASLSEEYWRNAAEEITGRLGYETAVMPNWGQ